MKHLEGGSSRVWYRLRPAEQGVRAGSLAAWIGSNGQVTLGQDKTQAQFQSRTGSAAAGLRNRRVPNTRPGGGGRAVPTPGTPPSSPPRTVTAHRLPGLFPGARAPWTQQPTGPATPAAAAWGERWEAPRGRGGPSGCPKARPARPRPRGLPRPQGPDPPTPPSPPPPPRHRA
ncbi:basic proline-rich protein-like [Myotis daubentonii]|uniref:basic proline-rich protein-like n=1 Tax=Myotis daubentonii TaxID=98922 RepID=UPI002872E064|nr:basic proline-rich protein-like [Myotis daubentonii]